MITFKYTSQELNHQDINTHLTWNNSILSCINRSTASRSREAIILLGTH